MNPNAPDLRGADGKLDKAKLHEAIRLARWQVDASGPELREDDVI